MKHRKKDIIWDLCGTLFKPDLQTLNKQEQADFSLLLYMWGGKKVPSSLDRIALNILNRLGTQQGPESEIIRLHTGDPVPAIICTFLAGGLTSADATEQVLQVFHEWAPRQKDISPSTLTLIERMLRTFFAPESLVHCMRPISEAVAILERSAGHDTHTRSILSNWDTESFELLYEKYQDTVLSYFTRERIIISGDTGFVKPQKEIYHYLLRHNNLIPQQCFFIDDQPENIEAAQALGMQGILFKPDKADEIEQALTNLNIIR